MTHENDIEATVVATTTTPTTAATSASTVIANTITPALDEATTTIVTVTTTNNDQMFSGENNANAPMAQQQQVQKTTTTTTSTTSPAANKGKMDNDPSMINFRVLYVLTQLVGFTMIVLVGTWISQYHGGLGGSDNPKVEFNWHPLLMTIGFIFLYGNSILVYRGFRTVRKQTLKLTHAAIHMTVFVLTVIALKTVFDSHNLAKPEPIPNMYSLHSWLGLSTVIIFSLQYVAGFFAYLVPGMRENYKVALMPLHIYFGLLGFVLAIASALMGLTEKAIFSYPDYSALPTSGLLVNLVGVLYIIFGALVVYLATERSYKRQPMPEDTALLPTAASD